MKRYFKITHEDGPPGLCILAGSDTEISKAIEALTRIDRAVVEIEQKDARKVRAEIARYEERQWQAQRAKARRRSDDAKRA